MAQPLSEIQTSVVTLFRGSTPLQGAMTGASAPIWNIFDNVPVSTTFPYLYVADMNARLGSAFAMNRNATDILLTLHIFSQYSGWKEVQGIVSAIDTLLNRQPLTLINGYVNFFTLFDNYVPIMEKDGLTRHGALRYRLMTVGG